MSMAEIERLERQIAELEAKRMAHRYGISAGGNVLLVLGSDTVAAARERRLHGVPAEIAARIRVQPVVLPWLQKRAVAPQIDREAA